MPKLLPPIEHRFTSATAPRHTQKHPNGYLTCLLKRLIEKKIRYEDPETLKIIKGKVKHAILWRYILNATQGENQAIEGILDRIDGKIKDNPLVDQSKHITIIWQESDGNGRLRNKNPTPLQSVENLDRPSKI